MVDVSTDARLKENPQNRFIKVYI